MPSREVAVAGVGMTRFTKQPERGHAGLVDEAVRAALADAGIGPADVGLAVVGALGGGGGMAQRTLKGLGLGGVPMVNVENACATGSTAFQVASSMIQAGMADVAVAVGVEILSKVSGPLAMPDGAHKAAGLNLPGWYALKANRYLHRHGFTPADLANVVVKSRQFAKDNPVAHFRTPTTIEEVLASATIAEPITLFQCCPKVDGAAAAVLMTAGAATRFRGDHVWVRGAALTSGRPVYTDDIGAEEATQRAALRAYADAGVDPTDLDVVELHDAFSIGELLYTEALGLCPPGTAAKHLGAGATSLGGDLPTVNPSGGLLSKGHPIGATGLGQIYEVVEQLRGRCGERQVPDARLGLAHTMGASDFDLDANACSIVIFERGSVAA